MTQHGGIASQFQGDHEGCGALPRNPMECEHFDPDRGILTLPQVAQRCHAVPDALRLAGNRVNTIPRVLEGAFELVQRVPQRGHEVSGLILLRHTVSLPTSGSWWTLR